MKFALVLTTLACLATQATAWGQDGHKIVATIAQIHLHPTAKEKLCKILPPEAKCDLAPVAAWADAVRGRHPDTGPMHYINPRLDKPGETCHFGDSGWINDKVNVVTAIHEKTRSLMNGTFGREDDENLRYLIHFMGDIHQPLHLTGYLRGGNDAWVKFYGRSQKLHSVWDSSILLRKIATLGNYTTGTGNPQLESALRGNIYDPYVRFIVKEGIWGWWKESSKGWFDCPDEGEHFPTNDEVGLSSDLDDEGVWGQVGEVVRAALPKAWGNALVNTGLIPTPTPSEYLDPKSLVSSGWSPACPYTWGKALHPYNCAYAWPKDYHHGIELDDGEYMERLTRDKIFESLLGQAGIRLAAVLNSIYADEEGRVGAYFAENE